VDRSLASIRGKSLSNHHTSTRLNHFSVCWGAYLQEWPRRRLSSQSVLGEKLLWWRGETPNLPDANRTRRQFHLQAFLTLLQEAAALKDGGRQWLLRAPYAYSGTNCRGLGCAAGLAMRRGYTHDSYAILLGACCGSPTLACHFLSTRHGVVLPVSWAGSAQLVQTGYP
jgi:hypothetical protein